MGSRSSSQTIINQAPPPRQAEKQANYGAVAPIGAGAEGVRGPIAPGGAGGMLGGAGAVMNAMLGLGTKRTLGG